jgi:hypothetical protein
MLKRISKDNYIKTGNELQENLTEDDIKILLEDYTEINEQNELKLGMHVRYYTIKVDKYGNQTKLFRMGGNIIKIDNEYRYLILSNNYVSWSVQINNSIFYKKMTLQDIKNIYDTKIDEKNFNINKYKDYINKLNKNYKKLEYQLNIINDKYTNLKNDYIKYKKN